MKLAVSILLKFDKKIPSINEYYQRARKHVFLNPIVVDFKRKVQYQLANKYPPSHLLNLLNEGYGPYVKVKIVYLLNAARKLRDEDNLRKGLQDSIFKYFQHDDKYIYASSTIRGLIRAKNNFDEYILFQIYLTQDSYYFDLDNPDKSHSENTEILDYINPLKAVELAQLSWHAVPSFGRKEIEVEEIGAPPLYSREISEENMETLKEQLSRALQLYTMGEDTGISDPEYDKLVEEYGYENYIKDIRTPVMGQGAEIPHPDWILPMLTAYPKKIKIEKAEEAVYDQRNEIKTFKYDGCSVVAYYKNGVPYAVRSRSSDYAGKDQTSKLLSMVQQQVDPRIWAIQYECVTANEDFGSKCRQKANGLVNSKYKADEVKDKLHLCAFNAFSEPAMGYRDRMSLIQRQDCVQKDPNYAFVSSSKGTFPIDGYVIYSKDDPVMHPKRIYKFYGMEKVDTEVINIEWNLSDKQVYVPKLILRPIIVGGSKISKVASGGIEKLIYGKMGVGAKLEIINNTVPVIYSVLKGSEEFMIPECPHCGNKMVPYANGVKCESKQCIKEQIIGNLLRFTGIDSIQKLTKDICRQIPNFMRAFNIPRINENVIRKVEQNTDTPYNADKASMMGWWEYVKSNGFIPKSTVPDFENKLGIYAEFIEELFK